MKAADIFASRINSCLSDKEAEISIILKNLSADNILYSNDILRVLPSASTIKILIMIETMRQVEQGRFTLNDKIKVKLSDKVEYSLITHMRTDEYCIIDLLILMMSISDNSATNILIDLLGYDSINATALELGLKNTFLKRKMMDFEAAKLGKQNVTSLLDMTAAMEKIYKNEIINEKMCKLMLDIMATDIEKDMMRKYIPEEIKISHKTGELDNINHDIGIIFVGEEAYLLGMFITGVKDNIVGRTYIEEISREVYETILIYQRESKNENK